MKKLFLLAVAVPFLGLMNTIYANGVTGQNLQDGLVAWYKFDGNANDSSGNGNNGTVHGATFTTGRNGNANGACLFEGDDWVVVPHSASLSVEALTISVWINPNGWYDTYWGGNMPIVCKANGGLEGSYRYQIEKHSETDVILHNVGLEGLRLNVWQQLTITTGNGTTCVYLNGHCVGCVQRETIRQYSDVLNIGRNVVGTSGEYYLGAMDDLLIYNRVLSAAEIAALYDGVADRETIQGLFDSDWTAEGTLDIKSGVRQVSDEIMLTYDSSWVRNGASVALKSNGANIATVKGAGGCAWNAEPGTYVLEHQVLNAEGNPIGVPESVSVEFVKQLSVSFDLNGGVGEVSARTFNIGFSYGSLPIVTTSMRPGYTFAGWFTAAQGGVSVTAESIVSESVTRLYAHWSANPYTVRFDANGGEGTMGDLNCTYGTGKALTACAFTRTGYTFAGWAKSAGGAVMYADRANVTDVAASGTVTLYAHWTPKNYNIVYELNGGTNARQNPAVYTIEDAITLAAATRSGYVFKGWTPNGGVIAKGSTGDRRFVANWDVAGGGTVDPMPQPQPQPQPRPQPKPEPQPEPEPVVEIVEPVQAFVAPAQKTVKPGVVLAADGSVAGVVQLEVGKASKKGESKVTVTILGINGKKMKSKAVQVATGAGLQRVTFDVKGYGALTLDIGADGFVGGTAGTTVASVKDGAATGEATVAFSLANGYTLVGLLTEYLPNGVKVTRTAKKWTLPKAGKLKYKKPNAAKGIPGGLIPTGENIAGLKLSYTAKTGVLKGSFKIWALDTAKGKLKSVSVKVTGVVVNGVGYCEATVKNQKIGDLIVE